MKAAFLEVHSWVGSCVGASHYYGKIWYDRKEVDVSRPMTAAEVIERNKNDYPFLIKKGCPTTGFHNEVSLRDAAVTLMRKELPQVEVLIECWHGCHDPRLVLMGPDQYKTKANEIVACAEIIDFWDGGKDAEMKLLYEEWKMLNELFEVEH